MLDGAIPEDLLTLNAAPNRNTFPEDMREDVIEMEYEIDIDRLPTPPPTLRRLLREREMTPPVEDRWLEEPEGENAVNGKSALAKSYL